MKNKNHTKAKALTLISLILILATVTCTLLSLYVFDSDTFMGGFVLLMAVGGLLLLPLPCLILSIIGMLAASAAKKEGVTQSGKFFVLGVFEIIVVVVFVISAVAYVSYGLFNVSMGV